MGVVKPTFKIFHLTFLILFLLFIYPNSIRASDIITAWTETTSLPYLSANHTSFIYGDNLYVIDGSAVLGGSHDEILRSTIQSNGQLSNWSIVSHLPQKLIWHTSINSSNYVYVLGGFLDSINGISANINNVYSSAIKNDGTLETWSSLNPLPLTLSLGASEIIGNKIYYAGGVTDAHFMSQTARSEIYMADINPDGSISQWILAGNLKVPNYGMKIITIGKYLYEIGGFNNAGGNTFVRRALINDNGTLGSWEDAPSTPSNNLMFGLVKIDNYLLTIGGYEGDQSDKIRYAIIDNTNDTISNWNEVSATSNLPIALSNLAVAVSGNKIYSIGGHNPNFNGYYNNVYVSEFVANSLNSTPSPSPSLIPSPSPTSSPSPIPSPSNLPIKKIIFAPGLGGSWNLDAIINCKTSNYSGTWQLAPFAKTIYQPFFDATNLTNWKLNTFYYDWRKDVRENASLLDSFVNSITLQNEKVNFVGHSMGGLIGRNYMETNSGGKFKSYISVGSPHKGSTYSYPTVSADVVENDDLIEKIATTILVRHCGTPDSIKNILPTYDYLKDKKSGNVKSISNMIVKNNYLPSNFNPPFWGVKVGTLSGNNQPSLKMYETNPPTLIDKLKGDWLDGKPVKKIMSNEGDGTVLLTSSKLDGAFSNDVIDQSHTGIIGATLGINKILDFLGTPPVEDPPFIEPKSALVLIGNNGNFWIKDSKGKITQSDQGVITLLNPKTEDFDFKFIPQTNNSLLIVAQFLPNGEVKYKEYKQKGFYPISKRIHFNKEYPKEDICSDK